MSLIDQRVRTARWRLWVNRYLHYLGICLAWAGAAWLIVIVVQKTFLPDLPSGYAALAAAAAAVVAALVWLIPTAEDRITAAIALDQAGAIKERLSTALYLRASSDPFSQATVADAERTAAMIQVRSALPLRYPRRVRLAAAGWGAALLVLWLLPTFDVTGQLQARQQRQEAEKKQQEIVARQVEQIRQAREQLQKSSKPDTEFNEKLKRIENQLTSMMQQPEKAGVEAVKQTTSLKEEVRKQQEALQQQAQGLQTSLSKLAMAQLDSKGLVRELSKSLASGDYKGARAALQQLQQEIQAAAHDPARAEQLASQLDELARALKDQSLSEQMSGELAAAGLNQQQIDSIDEAMQQGKPLSAEQMQNLQQAMRNQGLSDAQISQMMQKLANRMQACQMACRLGQSMADSARNLRQQAQQCSGQGQQCRSGQCGSGQGQCAGMAGAADQLSAMEAMQGRMQNMQALLSGLQGQPGQSQAQGGNLNASGTGVGRGRGGQAPIEHTATALKMTRAASQWRRGRIIGEYFDESQQVRGESRKEFVDVVTSAQRDAAKTIDEHKLPPQYDGPVGEYFRQLRQLGDSKQQPAPDKPAAQ